MKKGDQTDNDEMAFGEFVEYMLEHERQLRLAFSDLDRNHDGKNQMLQLKEILTPNNNFHQLYNGHLALSKWMGKPGINYLHT